MALFFKSRCYNGGKQHRFRARYDEKFKDNFDLSISPHISASVVEAARIDSRTHVFDVCVWCGKVRFRDQWTMVANKSAEEWKAPKPCGHPFGTGAKTEAMPITARTAKIRETLDRVDISQVREVFDVWDLTFEDGQKVRIRGVDLQSVDLPVKYQSQNLTSTLKERISRRYGTVPELEDFRSLTIQRNPLR